MVVVIAIPQPTNPPLPAHHTVPARLDSFDEAQLGSLPVGPPALTHHHHQRAGRATHSMHTSARASGSEHRQRRLSSKSGARPKGGLVRGGARRAVAATRAPSNVGNASNAARDPHPDSTTLGCWQRADQRPGQQLHELTAIMRTLARAPARLFRRLAVACEVQGGWR